MRRTEMQTYNFASRKIQTFKNKLETRNEALATI